MHKSYSSYSLNVLKEKFVYYSSACHTYVIRALLENIRHIPVSELDD